MNHVKISPYICQQAIDILSDFKSLMMTDYPAASTLAVLLQVQRVLKESLERYEQEQEEYLKSLPPDTPMAEE